VRLLSLTVRDFRNLENVSLVPSEHASVAVGPNGQGKTNLLEALYFLVTLKPLRASRLTELIRFSTQQARVSGVFELRGAKREISVEINPSTRLAMVDGKKADSLESYFGGVCAVAFTPDDLAIAKGAPDSRRAFLDRAVFNRFPAFLKEARDYNRALKNRNRILKERLGSEYLAAFDETLARLGARIWVRRRELMTELAPRAQRAFAAIGRAEGQAEYSYQPSRLELSFAEETEASLTTKLHHALNARLARDTERGFTSVGPHADDLSMSLGDRSARQYASQGQQRALILAWKIAEIENLRDSLGFLPLLLLDDVSSELDPERNTYLMRYLFESGAQVFLTTTDPGLVLRAAREDTAWYRVKSGQISAVEAGQLLNP
jgi:DNA replication and repair protein RecF